MKKHILPLALCTAAVAGGLFLAVNAHHDYARHVTLQNARTQAAQVKLKAQAILAGLHQAEATQAKQDKLQKNCQAGLNAYNQLTAFQKSHVAKPDCSI